MTDKFMLTTLDNPFDPFVDFTSWYMFDCENDHNTSSRIARLAQLDPEMSQKEVDEEQARAMEFIFNHDLEGKYVKVWEKQTATAINA